MEIEGRKLYILYKKEEECKNRSCKEKERLHGLASMKSLMQCQAEPFKILFEHKASFKIWTMKLEGC